MRNLHHCQYKRKKERQKQIECLGVDKKRKKKEIDRMKEKDRKKERKKERKKTKRKTKI